MYLIEKVAAAVRSIRSLLGVLAQASQFRCERNDKS